MKQRERGFELAEAGFVLVIVVVALVFAVAIMDDQKQERDLHDRYVAMCSTDMMKDDPTMTRVDAEEKCEVLYAMEKKRRPKDLNIVWVLN